LTYPLDLRNIDVFNNIIGSTQTAFLVVGLNPSLDNVRIAYNLLWDFESDVLWAEEYEDGIPLDNPPTEGMIEADPMFVYPDAGKFSLLPGSPAINAGDPDPQYNNPDGSRSHIGTGELYDVMSVWQNKQNCPQTLIIFDNNFNVGTSNSSIQVFDANGRLILKGLSDETGELSLPKSLPKGIYYLKARNNYRLYQNQLLKIK
jgi:hypothetical protein